MGSGLIKGTERKNWSCMWAAAENLHKAMRQEKNQKFFPFRAIALTD